MVERWKELSRQLELWVEIHELNEQGEIIIQPMQINLLHFAPFKALLIDQDKNYLASMALCRSYDRILFSVTNAERWLFCLHLQP